MWHADLVSKEVIAVLLLALGGFLIGGVYSTWKTAKVIAVALGVAAVLAVGGAVAWLAG
ncbi:hypothetical protein GCM10022222_74810 [Amycolatopsis ultiminotia]|uniref:Major facilitator superfamily (MFS) profile domain-containing protein n=1 Tax=Amycolatopsis ultiminotia TaxID=543629 RepID=A0ABP6Y8L1_9PSEU